MNLRGYGVCIAAFFTASIVYAVRYGYGMLVSLEKTKTQAGVIYAAYFIAYTVFSQILGTLSDRFDVRIPLTCFSALSAARVSIFLVPTPVRLILAVLLQCSRQVCYCRC